MTNGAWVCYEKRLKSYLYLVGEPLENVVLGGGIGVAGISDDLIHLGLQFLISGRIQKFLLEPLSIEVDEALHALALRHHHDQLQDLLLVLAQVLDSEEEQQLEVPEDIRIRSLHQLHIVGCQFERRAFEVHIPRRGRKHEAEIDVYDMPVDIHQDIVVVAVLDVEVVLD